MAGEEAAQHPDDRLEHLERSIDVEVQARLDPAHARLQLAVELHHVQRVERLHDRQADRMIGLEKLLVSAGNRLQLVVSPGEPLVGLPRPAELGANVGGDRRGFGQSRRLRPPGEPSDPGGRRQSGRRKARQKPPS